MATAARTFKLTTPLMTGDDIREFQSDLQARFAAWTINETVGADGYYGQGTHDAAQQVCTGLGILPDVAMKHGVAPDLRVKIRHPETRTADEITRSESAGAKEFRAKLCEQHKNAPTTFDGCPVASWIVPSLQWARKNGWSGRVASGYRSCEHQRDVVAPEYAKQHRMTVAQAYPHGPCASNHCGLAYPRGAVDVTEAQQLNNVLRNSPHKPGLVWGSIIDDGVHFSATGH